MRAFFFSPELAECHESAERAALDLDVALDDEGCHGGADSEVILTEMPRFVFPLAGPFGVMLLAAMLLLSLD